MEFSKMLLERFKSAHSVGVLTGAGISAASGVPTFRGEEGLWKKFRPEELANFEAFSRNPELVWEWYNWRRKLIQEVKPNLGHYALVDLEKLFPEFSLITQNVDNLHQTAGSKKIIELHGNIMHNKCSGCNKSYKKHFDLDLGIPHCPECRALIRPDVVWFGEMLPVEAIKDAQNFAINSDVFITIGTSSVVEPAASLPFMAKGNSAYVLEINTDITPLTNTADEHLSSSAEKVLPEMVAVLQKIRK